MKEKYSLSCFRFLLGFWLLLLLFSNNVNGQVSTNANDKVPGYGHPFSYGINMGYYPKWTRQQLADIAAGNVEKNVRGAGVNSLRPLMKEEHFDVYGYEHLLKDFGYYNSLGISNNTAFIGYPSSSHKDMVKYGGCSEPSMLFSKLYEPIWDSGENGTPINEKNFYALHVYKTVTTYKNYVKIWEVINEPDYTWGSSGWKKKGEPGNWWTNNPQPCELPNLKAPIFFYIRMLRISYEVIKQVDPSAFVAVGGIGYESFLDAVLRNTDNPDGGKVTSSYPDKGGAYFDVLSYHCYPQYKLSKWDNTVGGMVNFRHSDAAVDVLTGQKDVFQGVLNTHGYNGTKFPRKHFIITETNVPRKNIGNVIAGDQVQVNFVIKALVNTQRNGLKQFHLFTLGDSKDYHEATSVYELMGLYKNLNKSTPYNQQYNQIGIAYKTSSDLLKSLRVNYNLTNQLKLPSNIGGAVFSKGQKHMVVLWAKTTKDNSEVANATYTFPSTFVINSLIKREWNHASTNTKTSISRNNIALTGAPIFLEMQLASVKASGTTSKQSDLILFPNPAENEVKISSSSGADILSVEVKDQFGRSIHAKDYGNNKAVGNVSFEIGSFKKGVYSIKVKTSKGQEIKKLIKR